jgi:hypothetical protein
MKKVLGILITAMAVLPLSSFSQSLIDAYYLSSQKITGTARSAAMGNAFGALGGDFTSLGINPAGIAIYRSNELVFTPSARFNNSELSIGNKTFSDDKYKHSFNNIGYIGTISSGAPSETGIVSFNFGIGFNNLLDLNQNAYGKFDQSPNSYLDGIVNWANAEQLSNSYLDRNMGSIEYRDWPTKLAWETFLIDPATNNNGEIIDGKYVNILYPDEKVDQQMNYSYQGGIREFLLAAGANFSHKFYLGATVGIQDVDIRKYSEYTEQLEGNNSFTYSEENTIKGTGFNVKLGAIYKPVNSVRLGLAFHTPTLFDIKDDITLTMQSRLQSTHNYNGESILDYQLSSPFKVVMSGAVVINKFAILSIDGELVNYSAIKYQSAEGDNQSFSDMNALTKDGFGSVFNLRAGGEIKVNPNVSLRAGYELYPTPFKSGFSINEPTIKSNNSTLSAGLGYMSDGFFADFAFRHSTNTLDIYNPQPNFENISQKNKNNQLLLTLGFKF